MNLKISAFILIITTPSYNMNLKRKYPKLPLEIRLVFDKKNTTENLIKRVIEKFLQNGGNIEARDSYGRSMLAYACQYGHTDVIKFLHSNGANIESEDYNQVGLAPLERSILYEQEKSIETLTSLGADLISKDSLNLAIHYGKLKIVVSIIKALIKRDPNFFITKNIIEMAIVAAKENPYKRDEKEFQEIIDFLEYQIKLELTVRIIHKHKTTLSKLPTELLPTIIQFAYGPLTQK